MKIAAVHFAAGVKVSLAQRCADRLWKEFTRIRDELREYHRQVGPLDEHPFTAPIGLVENCLIEWLGEAGKSKLAIRGKWDEEQEAR